LATRSGGPFKTTEGTVLSGAFIKKGFGEAVRANTVTAPSVSERLENCQPGNGTFDSGFGVSRQERRSSLGLKPGEVFNPFQLFDGAIVPSEILRSQDLLPSEKLVFARLLQFAGGKGRAWPSIQRLAEEVALSVPQTRRCIGALESKCLIRRVARSGRSNEFEFLWHAIYEQTGGPRSCRSGVPQLRVSAPPQSRKIGPGRSPVIARRELIESSSSEEIHVEKNQQETVRKQPGARKQIDDDRLHRRREQEDPEQEFLLRLKERHAGLVDAPAILQCVLGDLKSHSDLKPFLDFEEKQTTAPEKLKNPPGHYRRVVTKFYEFRSKRRDGEVREQMRALEIKLAGAANREKKPICSLGQCVGTGECWSEQGRVSACECEIGRGLPAKVLTAFEQMNTLRAANGG